MNYLLIGKPNVGKSSIFNILTSLNLNIIHSESGTTRDWHKEIIKGTNSYVFDTPGILINQNNKKNIINFKFNENLESIIDSFIYVIEYKDGFNEVDNHSINQLRIFNKELILIINKFDNLKYENILQFNKYGIADKFFLSCSHRLGFNDFLSFLDKKKTIDNNNVNYDFSIAIFGKPNAGKSTFLNSLVGYTRSSTSPIAGTTSDYVSDYFDYKNKRIKIIDTAGIGKKSNVIDKSVNYYSIKKSFENIHKVDSAIIIIDSTDGLDRQDKRIIKLVSEKSKSLILTFNKFDLIENKDDFKSITISDIENQFSEVKNIKVFFISALNINNSFKVLDYLYNFFLNDFNISTGKLNKWLKLVVEKNQHPLISGKRVNFKYAVKIKDRPITIKIFCSYSDKLKMSYKRYLVNNFNYQFKILNQKTKFIFSSSKNPYI